MKTPQLFVKVGKDKYIPVLHPVKSKPLYFWDDVKKTILPAKGQLKRTKIDGVVYFVF